MQHHAYCYIGEAFARQVLAEHLAVIGVDTHVYDSARFGIDDARRLSTQAHQRPAVAAVQTFIVFATTLTHEAQNALLKLLEEPPPATQFHLVISGRSVLLPTLLSRVHMVSAAESVVQISEVASVSEIFINFQTASYADRLTHIADLVKKKDTHTIEAIVAGAERVARESKQLALMEAVLFIRQFLGTRGASTKMLLEQLALTLPQE